MLEGETVRAGEEPATVWYVAPAADRPPGGMSRMRRACSTADVGRKLLVDAFDRYGEADPLDRLMHDLLRVDPDDLPAVGHKGTAAVAWIDLGIRLD